MRRARPWLLALCVGCGHTDEPPAGGTWLDDHGVTLEAASTSVAELGWHGLSDECLHAYRITVSYDHNPPREPDTVSWLTLGPHPRRRPERSQRPGPVPPGPPDPARLFYEGYQVGRAGGTRDIYVSAHELGPSAPTSACYPRTWDPMDDALSLGWPRLPGRITARGEHWRGTRVEGRCNKTACIDPESFGGGEENHDRACVTRDWDETLAGIWEVGDERIAAVIGTWDDGHPLISAERRALISIDHGRPIWVEVVVNHRPPVLGEDKTFGPVQRTWLLEATDDCPGSLAALGWARSEEVGQTVDLARQRFELDEAQRRELSRELRRQEREALRAATSTGGNSDEH